MSPRRPLTPTYVIFYLLFSPDAWRILIGALLAALVTPALVKPETGPGGAVVIFLMCATIGYVLSAVPGNWISRRLRNWFLSR